MLPDSFGVGGDKEGGGVEVMRCVANIVTVCVGRVAGEGCW